MARGSGTGAAGARLTSFVGRTAELATVLDLLAEHRLVTLVGAGGIGKTRLALEAARSASGPVETWFVDLARSAGGAAAAIAEALRLPLVGAPTPEAVAQFLAGRDALVVLDNCEHLVDDVARLAQAVLAGNPTVRFLATSREPLRVPGEQLFRVPPLEVRAGETAASCDAVRLLVDRARRVAPQLSTDDPAPLVELCRRLDGLPLGIELAAARMSALTPQEIVAALDAGVDLLGGATRGGDERHSGLQACVRWSYQLLAEPEQLLLRRLAVLRCPFPMDVAEVVAGISSEATLAGVVALVDKSLFNVVPGRGRSHYEMPDVVRRFALDRLTEAGEEPETRDRHLDWLVAAARATGPEFEREGLPEHVRDWQERVGDVGAAIEWAAATGRAEQALQLVGALWRFWWAGAKGAGPALVDAALAIPGGSAAARARALVAATLAASAQLDFELAARQARAAVAIADGGADDETRALARCWLGWMLVVVDPSAAADVLDQAVEQAPAAAVDVVGDARNALAFLAVTQGRVRDAMATVEEVLQLTRASGNQVTQAHALTTRAFAALMTGHLADTLTAIATALPVVRSTNDATFTVLLLTLQVCANSCSGRVEDAQQAADELTAVVTVMQPPVLASAAQFAEGTIALAAGDHQRAEPLLAQALAGSVAGAPPLQILAATQLAAARTALADPAAARAVLDAVAGLAHDPHGWMAGRLAQAQARLAAACGDEMRATESAYDALAVAEALDDRIGIVDALVLLASLAVHRQRQAPRAARVAAAACAEAERLGYVLPASDRELVEAVRGNAASSTAWVDGRTLSVVDATAEIRTGRGVRGRPAAGWDSLTPAEHRVVELVVAGRSNPQIAAALFISAETVKGHVSAALRKLGVTTRAELAAYAARKTP